MARFTQCARVAVEIDVESETDKNKTVLVPIGNLYHDQNLGINIVVITPIFKQSLADRLKSDRSGKYLPHDFHMSDTAGCLIVDPSGFSPQRVRKLIDDQPIKLSDISHALRNPDPSEAVEEKEAVRMLIKQLEMMRIKMEARKAQGELTAREKIFHKDDPVQVATDYIRGILQKECQSGGNTKWWVEGCSPARRRVKIHSKPNSSAYVF